MKTPFDFASEVGEGNDLAQLKVIGRFGMAIAGYIAVMLIIPNPLDGRIAIATLNSLARPTKATDLMSFQERDIRLAVKFD